MTTSTRVVSVRRETVVLPTYEPLAPDKNPMFLEKRVYQGSSGKVYPLPFFNRISETSCEREWKAIIIENDFISVMVLPELGGRIHVGQDKTNGYDFFYRQNVIKPALVGLAGPWASGGVEFNWPQHHRPATFMPVDSHVEDHPDGSKTIWLSDHDPMERMKGMHGVCLYPEKSYIELKMRAYNRTPEVKTFLWWANVATHVNESYQSFFPEDVTCVADHAKRAMSRFPLCDDHYYGVNYGERARTGVPANEVPSQFKPAHCIEKEGGLPSTPKYAANDLSWYANIPVPTSYMCLGSKEDFSGGYDHSRQAGLVQVSNHHISPGKKQWTWGNHDFGYAWDRNLTERDGPYIELMLGVYTDNQPDFSFLQPGETKAWSVFWYPIQKIGPAQKANQAAAVSLRVKSGKVSVGVAVTEQHEELLVALEYKGREIVLWRGKAGPAEPVLFEREVDRGVGEDGLGVRVSNRSGEELVHYVVAKPKVMEALPAPASEPPEPKDVISADELFVIGTHLWQYRHATRSPLAYWHEALRRDPGDARCNNSVGLWHLRRGEFSVAVSHFKKAIARLTERNPNPSDGEAFYNLGCALRYLGLDGEAYDAFYKATWNQGWSAASFHLLAEIDCTRGKWHEAKEHLERSLRFNTENLRARNLLVLVLRSLKERQAAEEILAATLKLDPLDWWARYLRDGVVHCDTQSRLDVALDCAKAGFVNEALILLEEASRAPDEGSAPLVDYHRAELFHRAGRSAEGKAAARRASEANPDYCFPARLEDLCVLESAVKRRPSDAKAWYYLATLYYDRKRYHEAIRGWEKSTRLDPSYSVAWRNLGIAYFNVSADSGKALRAYEKAFLRAPADARVFFERDQLWKRVGESPLRRLKEMEKHAGLVEQRDDATIELCALYNQTGQPEKALALLSRRHFQPWEGGEGQALGQYTRTHLLLGRKHLACGDDKCALEHFLAALKPKPNLGEARHLLANQSDVHYWLGCGYHAQGNLPEAKRFWGLAAEFKGDFQEMSVRKFSEMTYYSAMAKRRLGKRAEADRLLKALKGYAEELAAKQATIDYFATSLPTMLLFNDDLTFRQRTQALFLRAQAYWGLGDTSSAKRLLRNVLKREPSHGAASDLLEE